MTELKLKTSPSMKKKALILFGGFLLAVAGLAGIAGFSLFHYAHSPSGDDKTGKIIEITAGQGFSATTARLVQEGVILSPARFKIIAALSGDDKKIKAGEYMFSASMTPSAVISALVNGKVYQHKLTVPEGYSIRQVAQTVENAGICSRDLFEAAAKDPLAVISMGIPEPARTFEGYLYPETYFYPRNTDPAVIVRDMVTRFKSVYKAEWTQRAAELGMTQYQVVTLASIIEKETGAASERPMISSVFHNRLKKNMRLETDPTVIYGVENFDGNLTRVHLRTPGPYNTYMNKGLPIGPIANPGYKSLEAALYPVQSDYIFFVSRKDGTHEFSATYEEHIQNIRTYQLRRRQPQAVAP
jgi:UPF0755 protein